MNTSYNEAGVDDLNVTAHKGLRQRLIMAIETNRQDSDTHVATRHRKIQDETRDSVQTSSSKNMSNAIKDDLKAQSSTVDIRADSSELCKNVTNLEIKVCDANETYSVMTDNIRTSLERVLSTSVKSFLIGSRFLDSLEEGATALVKSLSLGIPTSVPFVRCPFVSIKNKFKENLKIQCIFESDPASA